jgi:macrolide-specific efflux system membrane fusion protein
VDTGGHRLTKAYASLLNHNVTFPLLATIFEPGGLQMTKPEKVGSTMKLATRIVIAVLLLAVAGVGGWMYLAPSEARVEPQTIKVERGDIAETVLATGSLQASSITSIGAQVSGTIQTVSVRLGDAVKTGDLIAQIDSTNQQNAVKSAQASLLNMQAQLLSKQADLKGAQAALDRADKLAPQKLISDADLMTAQAGLASAQAAVASLEAQISQAKLAVDDANLALSRTTITAPANGTVVAVLVTAGQSVNANQTTPTIVKIADLDTMLIKAQISEADVTKVAPGQSATFTILGDPNTKIPATLLSVEPAPDAITTADTGLSTSDNAVYYNGLFSVANPDHRLRIAMTAQVSITINSKSGVLTLPASALGNQGRNGDYRVAVYDQASGKAHPEQVKVGLNNNITAEVLSGLNEGDLVVAPRTGASSSAASGNNGARRLGGAAGLFGAGRGG